MKRYANSILGTSGTWQRLEKGGSGTKHHSGYIMSSAHFYCPTERQPLSVPSLSFWELTTAPNIAISTITMTDTAFTSLNDFAALPHHVIHLETSLSTSPVAMSLESSPPAVITTAATPTVSTTSAATTTAVTTYTPYPDMSTVASDPSPGTILSETPSHLSRELLVNKPLISLQEAIEIATQQLHP